MKTSQFLDGIVEYFKWFANWMEAKSFSLKANNRLFKITFWRIDFVIQITSVKWSFGHFVTVNSFIYNFTPTLNRLWKSDNGAGIGLVAIFDYPIIIITMCCWCAKHDQKHTLTNVHRSGKAWCSLVTAPMNYKKNYQKKKEISLSLISLVILCSYYGKLRFHCTLDNYSKPNKFECMSNRAPTLYQSNSLLGNSYFSCIVCVMKAWCLSHK